MHKRFVKGNDECHGQIGDTRKRVAKYSTQFRAEYSLRLFAIRSLHETKNAGIQ